MQTDDTLSAPLDTLSTAIAHQTTSHRIDLEPAYRVDANGRSAGHGKAFMFFEGECIGESHQPAFDAARYLLAKGLALPSDRLTTYRNGKPCLFTVVGRAAKLTVREDVNGGLTIAAYRPFVGDRSQVTE
ncbi:hypothetical protein A1351_22100 [Methylosinus sp. R-45379]|uniref:hypothetical protein n=1 Tax=Methylosinus sp. R-45379 TaxID=980563 RepID=UPI0007C8A085|nr:hypothetical protein [Methylosinus sp. R-45379]OAI31087.1 hypothetical protein A1351_22100 [Methylosinus sp. R-45379]